MPLRSSAQAQFSYCAAGVDQQAADKFASRIQNMVAPARGEYAAALPLPGDLCEPVVAATCDGVGSKVQLLVQHGCADVAGWDLVAMCTNDLACSKARPWFMLDYYGCARLDDSCARQVVGGIARACAAAGLLLVGGETAQLPDQMRAGALDLVGFCVGLAERGALADVTAAAAGHAVVGLLADHPHCNGFTLVRRLLAAGALRLEQPCGSATVKEQLLAAAPLYGPPVAAALQSGIQIASLAHITGGGLLRNLPRMLPAHLGVRLDCASWERPPIFGLIEQAGVGAAQMWEVFNQGIGMTWCVPPDQADEAVLVLNAAGQQAAVVGRVVDRPGVQLA